jgi:hydroxypyruvate isomerase
LQAIWVKQSAQQKAVEQLCAAAAAGDTAAMEAALAAQPGLLSGKIFEVQTGVRLCGVVRCAAAHGCAGALGVCMFVRVGGSLILLSRLNTPNTGNQHTEF